MKRVRLFEISVDRGLSNCLLSLLLLLVSRFESHRSNISSGSSVNLISDTTGNRSFLRLYPHFLANIYVHFIRRITAPTAATPIDRSVLIFRLSHDRDRTAASILRRFPAHQWEHIVSGESRERFFKQDPEQNGLCELILGLDRQ